MLCQPSRKYAPHDSRDEKGKHVCEDFVAGAHARGLLRGASCILRFRLGGELTWDRVIGWFKSRSLTQSRAEELDESNCTLGASDAWPVRL